MLDHPHVRLCQEHPERYVLTQYTGIEHKNGKREFGNYDVLSRGLDGGPEHRDTIELGWSRDGQYGLVWPKSRAVVTKQDTIDRRHEIIGNALESTEQIAG